MGGEAADNRETLRLAQKLQPDVLLLDLSMPGPSSIETVAALRQQCPNVKVLIFSGKCCVQTELHELTQLGISGYLLKGAMPETVANAIRAVYQGDAWFSQLIVAKLVPSPEGGNHDLTAQELTILRWVAAEKTNREIAHTLNVCERTARNCLKEIYGKLGVQSRVGAVVQAIKLKLIEE